VRRLFSNFARGWPALGLLLMRIAAGAFVIVDGVARFQAGAPAWPWFLGLLAIADGAMLIAGLWTPLAGSLAVILAAAEILLLHADPGSGILFAAMGAGLALVGPGAVSVDARLFGLKKIDIDKLNGPSRR
jgi:putative oxidoreductase